jgi:hypothetical protein
MATTIISSIRVKPFWLRWFMFKLLLMIERGQDKPLAIEDLHARGVPGKGFAFEFRVPRVGQVAFLRIFNRSATPR